MLPVNIPLFVQFPLNKCVRVPPSKVVAASKLTSRLTVMFCAAVKDTAVPEPAKLVKLPAIVMAVAGIVLTTEPAELLNVRLP